jgi:hypothetical protein
MTAKEETPLEGAGVPKGAAAVGKQPVRSKAAKKRARSKSGKAASRTPNPKNPATPSGGGARTARPFPAVSLADSMPVAHAIRNLNGGNPWATAEVATALELSAKANRFFYVTASARAYGLTSGSRDTAQIELGPIGRRILYATTPENEKQALRDAFFNVDVFKRVFEYYSGGALPDLKYLGNTLETVFGIAPHDHVEFVKVYTSSLEYLRSQNALDGVVGAAGSEVERGSASQHSIVVGVPKGNTTSIAFVIIPFAERTSGYSRGFFEEVLTNLITPAAIEAGFKVETARREGSDVIHSTIVNDLLAADLVIADLTEHNPNVLFELGLRMASEKPTALIRARGTAPIFDVDNLLRVYDYDPNLWSSTLKTDLPKLTGHIKATWDGRDAATTYMQLLKRK